MATSQDLVNWATKQIGYTEQPPGSNRTKYWDQIGMHGLQGQSWCGAFVTAGLKAVGINSDHFVYCPTGRTTFSNEHRLFSTPQVGDIVFYNFGKASPPNHTGIVVGFDNTNVVSIEGNTTSANSGDQSNGGGVFKRTRSRSLCMGFGRPLFTAGQSQPIPAPVIKTIGTLEGQQVNSVTQRLTLDGNGNGSTEFFGVPHDKWLHFRVNPANNYDIDKNLPRLFESNIDGHTHIEAVGGPSNGAVDVEVRHMT